MSTPKPEPRTLVVTTWTPGLARGTRRKETYTFPDEIQLLKFACWNIMMRVEVFDHHYQLGLRRCWNNNNYHKLIQIWDFIMSNPNKVEPGLRLEWDR